MNILTRKLETIGPLSDDDRRLLDEVISPSRMIPARTDIVRQGDVPTHVTLILEGFACRYKILPDGQRHIMAYLVPGDLCDIHIVVLSRMDHSIATLSECRVVSIAREQILELTNRPAIARALWWSTLVDEATLREWLVNIGQRDASHRIAHLLCEIFLRLQAVRHNNGNSFQLPITQTEIADTMGLSAVHVNRSIQVLREKNLVVWKGADLVIPDVERLLEYSQFDSDYLHLGRASALTITERGRVG